MPRAVCSVLKQAFERGRSRRQLTILAVAIPMIWVPSIISPFPLQLLQRPLRRLSVDVLRRPVSEFPFAALDCVGGARAVCAVLSPTLYGLSSGLMGSDDSFLSTSKPSNELTKGCGFFGVVGHSCHFRRAEPPDGGGGGPLVRREVTLFRRPLIFFLYVRMKKKGETPNSPSALSTSQSYRRRFAITLVHESALRAWVPGQLCFRCVARISSSKVSSRKNTVANEPTGRMKEKRQEVASGEHTELSLEDPGSSRRRPVGKLHQLAVGTFRVMEARASAEMHSHRRSQLTFLYPRYVETRDEASIEASSVGCLVVGIGGKMAECLTPWASSRRRMKVPVSLSGYVTAVPGSGMTTSARVGARPVAGMGDSPSHTTTTLLRGHCPY